MNNSVIYIFLMIANVIAIAAIYFAFGKRLSQDKKMLYTMISIGIIYIATLIVYFFSSIGVNNSNVTNVSRNMITFSFVPVNAIILLPFLIYSFAKTAEKELTEEKLKKRITIVAIIAIILVITEFFYFKNIQKNIITITESLKSEQSAQSE